ncbi:hypothetical protein AKJ16_DCAP17498 [Drosera capensis]
MHIEKNVFVNMFSTVRDMPSKAKDNMKSRRDLELETVIARGEECWSKWDLCSNCITRDDMERLEKFIPDIICKLERLLPPSFFNFMEHLPIHLPFETKIGGLVYYRWMYVFERRGDEDNDSDLLDVFRRNGGYAPSEKKKKQNRRGEKKPTLDEIDAEAIHRYILNNCKLVAPF